MSTLDLALVPFLNPNGTIRQEWYLYLFGQNSDTNSNATSIATVNAALTAVTDELRSLPVDQALPTIASLDTRVQALESQPLTAGGGAGVGIKSIQRGIIAFAVADTSLTATITAVDTAKTELRYLGTRATNAAANEGFIYIVLTDSTTITANRSASANGATVSWELTEWY